MSKQLTIRDIENQDRGGIFVLNKSRGIEKGRIVFQVPKLNGIGSDAVVIPATFIPIDLTEQVSRKQVLESSAFRRAVNSRRIELISEEEYNSLMGQPGATEEQNKLFNMEQVHMNTVQSLDNIMDRERNVVDPALAPFKKGAGETEPQTEHADTHDMGGEEGRVHPAVLQVVASLEDDKDETAAVNTLRSLGELSLEDYTFVMKNADRSYSQLRTYCNRNIQRLSGKANQE